MKKLVEDHWATLVGLFLLAMLAQLLIAANTLGHQPDGWLIGDWLINYQGGFVRRGLPGQIFLTISSATGLSPVTLITLTQVLLSLCTFAYTFKLAKSVAPGINHALILFSPAFIQFMSLGLDGLRKDMLLFALLSYHSYRMSRSEGNAESRGYLAFLSLAFVVLVLSNEMLLALLPYFISGLYLKDNRLTVARFGTYVLLLLPATLAAATVILFFRGNNEVVSGICNSLSTIPLYDCLPHAVVLGQRHIPEAIGFLALNFSDGVWAVTYCNPPKSLVVSGMVLTLAMAPIFYFFRKRDISGANRYWVAFPIVSLVATLPLLLVFADYGRLTGIHVICLTYVVLQILNMDKKVDGAANNSSGSLAWILCLAYILGWKIAAFNPTPSKVFPVVKIYKELKAETH